MKNWIKWKRATEISGISASGSVYFHLEGEDQKAEDILVRYQNKSFNHNELEQAGLICICVP